jgi:predicted RNase H-like nuclease (RuvC/YqgF family)
VDRDVAAISNLFWSSALAEFKEGLDKEMDILKRIEVDLPRQLTVEIVKALHRGSNEITQHLKKIIAQQSVFTDPGKRRFLFEAPVEKIHKMTHKLSEKQPRMDKRAKQNQQALALLEEVEKLKSRLQRKLEAAAALKAGVSCIGSDQLLEAMLEKVMSVMYLPHWIPPKPAKWDGKSKLPSNINTYQATM